MTVDFETRAENSPTSDVQDAEYLHLSDKTLNENVDTVQVEVVPNSSSHKKSKG